MVVYCPDADGQADGDEQATFEGSRIGLHELETCHRTHDLFAPPAPFEGSDVNSRDVTTLWHIELGSVKQRLSLQRTKGVLAE